MKNKKILICLPIILIVLILCILIFLVSPIKNIALSDNIKQPVEQLLTIGSANEITYNRENSKLMFELSFSASDIERVAYSSIKYKMKVDGLEVNISNNNVKIFTNTYLLGFIKTQYILQLKPYIKDNTLAFTLENANAGRIPISKALALDKMKTLNLQNIVVDDNGISVENKLVRPFQFSDVKLESDKLKVNVSAQLKLIQDLKKLLNYEIPNKVKIFIENILKDFFSGSIFNKS